MLPSLKIFVFSAVFLLAAAKSHCQWWTQNDYSWGAGDFQKESFSAFVSLSTAAAAGVNATLFKKGRDESYSLKIPLSLTGRRFFISVTPFFYPRKNGDSAAGGKVYYLRPVGVDTVENYTHFIFTAAAAGQKTEAAGKTRKFSHASLEAQVEKNYYNHFFFLGSASLFKTFSGVNPNSVAPAMDFNDMAFLGTFAAVNRFPHASFNFQFARNVGSDYDTYLYTGFSRTIIDSGNDLNSIIIGTRMKLTRKSSLDFGYNWLKPDGIDAGNYYKLFLQVFF